MVSVITAEMRLAKYTNLRLDLPKIGGPIRRRAHAALL